MLVNTPIHIVAVATIMSASRLTFEDINPIAHIYHYIDRMAQSTLIGPFKFGSPARTRTADPMVNSHLLCQLSYWGLIKK
jgi:hypothetical protein